jgi:hypothetical protein
MRARCNIRTFGAALAALFIDPIAEALWPWCSRAWRFERIGGAS